MFGLFGLGRQQPPSLMAAGGNVPMMSRAGDRAAELSYSATPAPVSITPTSAPPPPATVDPVQVSPLPPSPPTIRERPQPPSGIGGASAGNEKKKSPYEIMQGGIGLNETQKVAALRDFLTTGGQNLDPATYAWCAAAVNSSLQQAGYKGTGSNMARSFLQYGDPVKEPQQGDIAVFTRGNPRGPYGHVGFFSGYNPDGSIKVLGGNQSNAINYQSYPANRLLGYRRPKKSSLTQAMLDRGI